MPIAISASITPLHRSPGQSVIAGGYNRPRVVGFRVFRAGLGFRAQVCVLGNRRIGFSMWDGFVAKRLSQERSMQVFCCCRTVVADLSGSRCSDSFTSPFDLRKKELPSCPSGVRCFWYTTTLGSEILLEPQQQSAPPSDNEASAKDSSAHKLRSGSHSGKRAGIRERGALLAQLQQDEAL